MLVMVIFSTKFGSREESRDCQHLVRKKEVQKETRVVLNAMVKNEINDLSTSSWPVLNVISFRSFFNAENDHRMSRIRINVIFEEKKRVL